MFNWRRRNEGFEWREYVRTTILVRRKERRDRLKDAGVAAADQVKKAGKKGAKASADGLKNAAKAAQSANSWMRTTGISSLAALLSNIWSGLKTGASWTATAFGSGASGLLSGLAPWCAPLSTPKIQLVLITAAVLTLGAAAYRWWQFGIDSEVLIVASVGTIAALISLLTYLTGPHDRDTTQRTVFDRADQTLRHIPVLNRFSSSTIMSAVGAAVVLAFVGYGLSGPTAGTGAPRSQIAKKTAPVTTASTSKPAPASAIKGRARALSGDTIRIGNTQVQLTGIEAPLLNQTCKRANGRNWDCGRAARRALTRLVGRATVTCDATTTKETRTVAKCSTKKHEDLSKALVENGHVFSKDGFFSAYYGTEQTNAQEAGKGIWAGDAERPEDFRNRVWKTATASAPDGCPIKGRVKRKSQRVYVLPWDAGYNRTRVRESRGDRWFCTEAEAKTAGFKAAS